MAENKESKPKLVKVRWTSKRGASVNVPHSEHRLTEKGEWVGRQVVTFDEKGEASVPEVTAKALVELFARKGLERV